MSCPDCAEHQRENRMLRTVVHALWADLRERYKQGSGRYDREPVPPLLMRSGAVVVPVDSDEYPPEHERRRAA